MHDFERWLVAHSSQMANLENTIHMLTLFAPGQNNDVELWSEAAGSVLRGFGLYHDKLVALTLVDKKVPLSPHSRYVRAQLETSKPYAAVAYTLSGVRCCELLVEMLARQRGGERGRWNAVIGVESLKAGLRLILLSISHRPSLEPAIYERELDPAAVEDLLNEDKDQEGPVTSEELALINGNMNQSRPYKMRRTGKTLPPVELSLSGEASHQAMMAKMLKSQDLRPPIQLLRKLDFLTLSGDIVSIFRPLFYALIAFRMRKNKRSWTPWVMGLLIEFLGRQLSAKGFASAGNASLSTLELEQLKRKTSSLWNWALRGPMYEYYTRRLIVGFSNKLSKVPLISMFSVLVHDYLYLFDTYYFPSASL